MPKRRLREPEDDSDRKLLSDVARVGWHLVGIQDEDDSPDYVFSVGLYHTFGQPEIMIVGLAISTAGRLINSIGEMMQTGKRFNDCDILDDIADGFPMAFKNVTDEYYRAYVGYAIWFYESTDFPLLQCFWPDRQSRFPWDRNCDDSCKELQALIHPGG